MQFNIFKHLLGLPGARELSSLSNSGQGYIPRGKGNTNGQGSAGSGESQGGSSGNGTGSGGHITTTSQGSATAGGRRPSRSE
ncbi:uncharacterized protein EV420DRAFT_1757918 [Desarmillaria tabescens]|uniref:Uncharacterized protein n=1 Tax=Armillaria tabescens TaxID=1929756 RepID=A0AA39NR93_ARMTA|nr:uncharacterized protein EV420DRAFT_1757918 [Desarmillaria tabescens]KAK0470394.1 hypothetical protein EV420DRAFT_1757918 [Desarmillaria tabescens]